MAQDTRRRSSSSKSGSSRGTGSRTSDTRRRSSSTKRRKGKRAAARKRRRIIIFALEAVALVILVGVLYFVSKLDKMQGSDLASASNGEEDEDLSAVSIDSNDNLDPATTEKLEGFTTIALFGVDSRTGILGKGSRSDTIIIASINNQTKEVKLCSVFRDTYLNMTTGSL